MKRLLHLSVLLLLICSCQKEEVKIEPNPTGSFTDARDGKTYKWVQIGNQTWMAENLQSTKYIDGSVIQNITDNTAWAGLITGAYCWYNNDAITYQNLYGGLYNWYAVNSGKLCPAGWHVPADTDWKILEMALGMTQVQADAINWRGTNQAIQIKTTSGWNNNGNGTNSSGFSALRSNLRSPVGSFTDIGSSWWSSTAESNSMAWRRFIDSDHTTVNRDYVQKIMGLSVRCVKD